MLPELRTAIPGPRSRALAARLRRSESRNVTFTSDDWPIFWERAEGVNVWDADGNRFLDFTSAFGVTGLGHTRPELRDALAGQAATLMHAMGDVHPTEVKVALCEQLSALTFERWGAGPGKTILGNSGFEAIEAALKTALLHTGKPGVLAFTGGYHGLGFGALAAAGIPYFREPFRRQLKDFATLLPYPTGLGSGLRSGDDFPRASAEELTALRTQIETVIHEQEMGAILVEPIQGRGGCVVPPREFLPLLRAICDEHGLVLIADEILTGFHRTGALFACDHSGVMPDLVCLGKALTGGFPMSACVGRADIMDAWPLSHGEALHTSTFLGNPMGCAMALAALHLHTSPTPDAVSESIRTKGAAFKRALQTIVSPRIREVRGTGLLLGVELVQPGGPNGIGAPANPSAPDGAGAIALTLLALQAGLLILPEGPHGNTLGLQPPFGIAEEEMQWTVEWLRAAL